MLAERLPLTAQAPESSSATETPRAFASGSIKVMSGSPLPVSHFETALSVTPTVAASSRWVQPFFSRSVRMVFPVR